MFFDTAATLEVYPFILNCMYLLGTALSPAHIEVGYTLADLVLVCILQDPGQKGTGRHTVLEEPHPLVHTVGVGYLLEHLKCVFIKFIIFCHVDRKKITIKLKVKCV